MNIYAEYGDKVVARHLDNGWDSDKTKAQKYLEQDKEYTVDWTDVHSSSTDVYLVEIPNVHFNSVHFEDVPTAKLEVVYGRSKPIYVFDCCKCKMENMVSTPYEDNLNCSYCGKVNSFEFDMDLVL